MSFYNDKEKAYEKNIATASEQINIVELENPERRSAIRKLAIGTAALAGCSILPDKWITPWVEFGTLPAHATTSGEVETSVPAETSAPAETGDPVETTSSERSGTNDFNLLFIQTEQNCASCGIWFDSAELVIVHSEGTFKSSQSGSLLIKKTTNKQGSFYADMSSIPSSATIQSATLYMLLNAHEGIANSDYSSVIDVYDFSGGSQGSFVREITASGDIKGKGYSKSNPNVPIDFTDYARQVH